MSINDLGMGVLLKLVGGSDRGAKHVQAAIGRRIGSIEIIEDDRLELGLDDDQVLVLKDEGQSCCEQRYMHTDDDLAPFIGAELRAVELREGPTEEDKYGDPIESQFLIVTTSEGSFTIVNYNEHNGYYGGFWLEASLREAP